MNWPSGVQELFDTQGWSATNDPYGLDSRGEGEGVPTPETYQRAMRKRQVWVERLLAVPELGLGEHRFRRRGLENVNIEGLLIAAGQNLKRLLAARGWGRRHG